jgi:ribosome-binding factor A
MVSEIRAHKIADKIFRELSLLLIQEVSDPRLNNISITKVSVDRELAFASIYVSSYKGREASKAILEGLNHARGYLRRELSQRIQLRFFPRLRFYWDPIPEQADRIDMLLDSISEGKATEKIDHEDINPNG